MPVVTLYFDELERMVGVSKEKIIDILPMIGSDIERIEEDHIDVEFFPNRPDLYSVEGVARALRGIFEIEKGFKKYSTGDAGYKLKVDRSVEKVRPYISGMVVRGIELTDEVIRSLIELQEDLHWTIGRNRRRVAIGIHDLSVIKFPLVYTTVDENFSFIPLDYSYDMTVREILEYHEKGIEYGFILKDSDRYPIILDANNEVLSMPPIINCERTRVTDRTTDLFIDVTGMDESVDRALNIIATMLADRGGSIYTVDIIEGNTVRTTPDLSGKEMKVSYREVFELLGTELSEDKIKDALEKMRFDVKMEKNWMKVRIPPYRADIMHPWDVIEDIAIGHGYDRLTPVYPPVSTIGVSHPWEDFKERLREIMTGLGYMEVITFTLSNERIQYRWMRRDEKRCVKVMHPISEDHTIIRTDLLPSLLHILSMNRHRALPQRIFEVGEVVENFHNRLRLCGVSIHPEANFSEVRSIIDRVMRETGVEFEIDNGKDGAFIEGRCGRVMVEGKETGLFGEVHPEVLEKFDLVNPVVGFEIEADILLSLKTGDINLIF